MEKVLATRQAQHATQNKLFEDHLLSTAPTRWGTDGETADSMVTLLQEELAALREDHQQAMSMYRSRIHNLEQQHQATIADLQVQITARDKARKEAEKAKTVVLLLQKNLVAASDMSAGFVELAAMQEHSQHQMVQRKLQQAMAHLGAGLHSSLRTPARSEWSPAPTNGLALVGAAHSPA